MIKKILGLFIIGLFTTTYVNSKRIEQESVLNIPLLYKGLVVNSTETYNNDMLLQNNGNFLYNNSLKVFKFKKTDSYQRNYILFRNEGKLYLVFATSGRYGTYPTPYIQGYLNGFCECDIENRCGPNLTADFDNPPITDFNSYFHSNSPYASPDFITIERSDGSQFCFGYDDLGKKLCFEIDIKTTSNGLSGSLNLTNMDENYLNTITNLFENSPSGNSSGGSGETEEEITKPITTHPCMTLNELFELRPQYNTGLCYSSDKIRNGTSFETTTQKSIYELYPTYNEFKNDLNLYHNYCGNYVATQTACQNAFSGKQTEYSLISKLPNNINDKDLYNYCDLALNYDRNTSTCVINSGATTPKPGTEPTYEDIINAITNQNIQNQAPATGSVFDELCEEGDEECLQNMAVNRNILESLQNIYDKITSLFEKRTGVEGLIPSYIMRLIFLTLFFTILLKK